MTDIFTERSEKLCTSDSEKELYQVNLSDKKQYSYKAKKKEVIDFKRKGDAKKKGFSITFDPKLGSDLTYTTATDESKLAITIPDNPADEYKYTVSYDNDGANIQVLPLDPLIIIKQSAFSVLFSTPAVSTFFAGIAFGLLAIKVLG